MSQQAFDTAAIASYRGKILNLERQNKNLRSTIDDLEHTLAMTTAKFSNACSELQQTREELELYKGLVGRLFPSESGLTTFPFLQKHVLSLGHNFPEENIPIMLQMAQCGEGLWALFKEHLGFPSWRQIQRWRASCLERIGISKENLNGEISNLRHVFQVFLGENYAGQHYRVVLAVDAAGVSPRVVVHKNGQIDGFVDSDATIPVEQAILLRNSLADLRGFVSEHHDDIVRDFFVVFVCPLESHRGGFPIFLFPKCNGSADPNFTAALMQLLENVRQCSVEVVGLGCDGDPGYLRFVRDVVNSMDIVDISRPLHGNGAPALLMFEDLLHLAKCIRYRLICGSNLCPFPHKMDIVCVQEFLQCGIVPWVLDPSQVRKMDDFLPIMMFNVENVLRALDQGKPNVSICLLPTALMLSAVMDSNLTRNQRLNYLSQAWAFFWCYKQAYTNSLPSVPAQSASKMKGTNQRMAIYDKITCDKAISLCYALSRIIADPKAVHLGALGTHWLEHFFGNVRRLCNRNDCPGNFERSIYLIMMKKALNGPSTEESNRNRLSDSGAILPPDTQENCLPDMPIGSYIFEAQVILQLLPHMFKEPFATLLRQTYMCQRRPVPPQFLLRNMVYHTAEPRECGSTRTSRMTDVAGLTTRNRDIMAGQI